MSIKDIPESQPTAPLLRLCASDGLGIAPDREGQALLMTISAGEVGSDVEISSYEVGHWYSPAAIRDMLAAERELWREDAERYRWLRDVASGGDWEHIGQTTDPTSTDARIDERMAAYKAVGAA